MGKFQDLTGQRFGRLTVLSFAGLNKYKNATWLCKCECGNEKIILACSLKQGHTVSCGCYKKQNLKDNTTHNLSKTTLFRKWQHMKGRCYRKTDEKYKNYGARGIKICDEWLRNFKNFYDWAYSNGYKDGLSIERIDVNGDYCPENCKFIPIKEQAKNRTTSVTIEYNNEKLCMTEMAKKYNIPYEILRRRIKNKWDIEKALKTPPRKVNRNGSH